MSPEAAEQVVELYRVARDEVNRSYRKPREMLGEDAANAALDSRDPELVEDEDDGGRLEIRRRLDELERRLPK
jgi:hypothetical protein